MGQKVNPHGMRVGIIKDWDSRWFADKKHYGDTLVEDYNLREFIKKKLYAAGIARIEIERLSEKVRVHIHCAKPGLVICRGGAEIDKLREDIQKKIGGNVNINRLRDVEITDLMKSGAKGIKIKCGGRLGGAEIARSECYHEGTIPLQTIRADIDYGFAEANTTYGRIGIKVWIYKGEILKGDAAKAAASKERYERKNDRPRDNRRRRDDRNGGGDRRPRRDFNGNGGDRRPRTDRPQGNFRREGGTANAASKES